jgi:hypothetical protein
MQPIVLQTIIAENQIAVIMTEQLGNGSIAISVNHHRAFSQLGN